MGRSTYYYFLGKVLPWGTADVPPVVLDASLSGELDIRNEIVAMEKINGSDVSLVISRHDWVNGLTYDMWDSTFDMTSKMFYVMTDEYNVYKCIYNNKGTPSTIKPYGTSISLLTTPDGYVWKYMYSVPLAKRNKFESSAHIPVQRSMADSYYDSGSVIDVLIQNQGSGYTEDFRVTINTIGGSPTTQAELLPVVSAVDGSITSIIIVNPGSGFISVPTLQVTSDDGNGTGLWNPTAIIRAIVENGEIVRCVIDDPGVGYPSGDSTYIDVDGDGTGAILTPIIRDGKLTAVSIDNRGSGYTFMNLQVMGNGTGASVIAKIGGNDLTTEQSLVESTAIDGGIHVIPVTVQGNSYTNATVEIIGDGTGATAIPVIQGGTITEIMVTSPGNGYTNAKVIITGDNLVNNPAAISASAYAIMSPIGGHGKDAPRELFANTVCLYSVIRYSTNAETNISQDFRQYGVIKNPAKAFTGTNLTETFALTTYTATLSGVFGISKDDVLHNGTDEYRVVDVFPGNIVMLLPLNTRNLLVGATLSTANNVNNYSVTTISAIPLANKYSGEMLFTSADYSFAFNTNQSVTIKTYMKL